MQNMTPEYSDEQLLLQIQHGDEPKATIALPPQPAAICAYEGKEVIAGVRAEAISYGTGKDGQQRSTPSSLPVNTAATGYPRLIDTCFDGSAGCSIPTADTIPVR